MATRINDNDIFNALQPLFEKDGYAGVVPTHAIVLTVALNQETGEPVHIDYATTAASSGVWQRGLLLARLDYLRRVEITNEMLDLMPD